MIQKLACFKGQPQSEPVLESFVIKNRHQFTKEPVNALHRWHHAGGGHEKITLTRALQTGNHPIISSFNAPINAFDTNYALIAHRSDRHIVHLDG